MRRSVVALAAMAVLTAACGNGATQTTTAAPEDPSSTMPSSPSTPSSSPTSADGDPNAALLRADVPRNEQTGITADELEELVAANDAFALDLFHQLAGDGNLVFSPNSVATALTMTLAGAKGTTEEQMRTVLQLDLIEDRLHAARNELDLRVNTVPPTFEEDEREPFTVRTANSVWGQPGYPFLDSFLELLATEYDAGLYLADFAGDAESARVAINEWVEDKTEGRIEDLIPPGTLDAMTRMVLVNAIWFKASWAEQFDPDATRDLPFTLLDGSTVDTPTMRGDEQQMLALETADFTAVAVPYAGDAAMLIVMPAEGRFDGVVGEFTAADLADLDEQMRTQSVILALPKFEMRSELSLNPALISLGMEAPFIPPPGADAADFTGITDVRELYISEVVHQAFIDVNEEGTEAAAATAVILRATSAPIDEPLRVTIDRPFLFMIRHSSTGEILFLGQVTNPAAS